MEISEYTNEWWFLTDEQVGIELAQSVTDDFIEQLESVTSSIEVVGEYVSAYSEIEVRCKACGQTWFGRPSLLLRGDACPTCGCGIASKKSVDAKKEAYLSFVEAVKSVNPDITVLTTLEMVLSRSNNTRYRLGCNKCGYEWSSSAYYVRQNVYCPSCQKHEKYVSKLAEIQPDIELLEPYTKGNVRVKVRCNKCGKIWMPYAANLLSGYKHRGCIKD